MALRNRSKASVSSARPAGASSTPESAASAVPAKTDDAAAARGSVLLLVLRTHRFVALSFGLIMILRPDRAIAIDPRRPWSDPDRGITPSEALMMRCWGCFVVAVSYIVHKVANAPHSGPRRAVGRALCGCFGAAGLLVARAAVDPDPSWGEEERAGHVLLAAIFSLLSVAYGAGLAMR